MATPAGRAGRKAASETGAEPFNRVLGLTQVTMSGIAVIIGAGIFVLLGPATQAAGGAVWLAFVLASLLSALTAFSYMELASMFPKAGSEYEFTRQVFPRWVATSVGWAMSMALVVSTATVALGFSRYLNEFVRVDERLVSGCLIVGMAAISYLGMQSAGWLIVVLGVVEIGTLVAVAAMGVPALGDHDLTAGSSAGVITAAGLVFFAFIGFDEVITLSEETQDPVRTVPKALLLALGVSTLLYVGVAISTVSVLGPETLASEPRPLAAVAERVLGVWGAQAVSVAALVSTSTTVLLALTAASRMLYAIATQGELPSLLAIVRHRRVPLNALLFALVGAISLLFVGDLKQLAEATDALIFLTFIAVNLVVIILRRSRPELTRPFVVPGSIGWLPVLPVLGLATVGLVASNLDRRAIGLAGILIGAGLLVHAIYRRATR